MSKTKLLLDVVSDLRSLANSINSVCTAMTADPNESTEAKQTEPESIPTEPPKPPKPSIKIEQVRAVLAGKSQAGKTVQVRELLVKFGASKLSEINPEVYSDLLTAAEEL